MGVTRIHWQKIRFKPQGVTLQEVAGEIGGTYVGSVGHPRFVDLPTRTSLAIEATILHLKQQAMWSRAYVWEHLCWKWHIGAHK